MRKIEGLGQRQESGWGRQEMRQPEDYTPPPPHLLHTSLPVWTHGSFFSALAQLQSWGVGAPYTKTHASSFHLVHPTPSLDHVSTTVPVLVPNCILTLAVRSPGLCPSDPTSSLK